MLNYPNGMTASDLDHVEPEAEDEHKCEGCGGYDCYLRDGYWDCEDCDYQDKAFSEPEFEYD